LLVGISCTPVPAADPVPAIIAIPDASPFTLGGLERIALERNPTLAQAAAKIDISRGKALQAGLYPNPIVGYEGEQIGAAGTAGERQGAFIQQEIVRGGKLRLSRAKYTQEAYQAELQALAQQLRVINGIHLAFYAVLADQRLIDVHRELLKNAEDAVKTTEELVNVGQANRPDLLQARIEAKRTRVDLQTAENNYRKSWEHLVTTVGSPELPPTPLAGKLEPDGPPLEWDTALCRLLQDSPEMQFAQAEVVRDQITVQREKVEPIPNAIVRAATGYNFETQNQTADVSVGFRLPLFDRNQGTIQQAQAELARAHQEVTRLELSLRHRLADVFARYRNALVSVEDFRQDSLPMAREAYQLLMDQFRKRRAAWPQVLVAERTYQQLSVEYVKALIELRRAEVEINGLLLVDGLTEPPGPRPGGHIDATPKPR